MNLVDHVVKKVEKIEKYEDLYIVHVIADCYGRITKTRIHFKNKDEAEKVKKGYVFKA